MKKYGLALKVEKTLLETANPSLKLPVLKMTSWVKFMLKNNCWHTLCGLRRPNPQREQDILSAFWKKYQFLCPRHKVFDLANSGQIDLKRTCPVVLHGDEGRGRKHQAYLVVSWRSLLGRGLHPGEADKCAKGVKKPYLKQKCNYIGHAYTNRFMIAGIRKTEYTGANSQAFDCLMSLCAEEACHMYTTGVADAKGQSHWLAMLYITGDWPWLCKSGSLSRSFNRVQKQKSQQAANGICHQCSAGMHGIPFEEIATSKPQWLRTEFALEPSDVVSPFAAVPHIPQQLGAFWTFDFFHTFHLGVARQWIGGSLALMSMHENGTTVDQRFDAISTRYKSWCLQTKRRAHIQKVTKEVIGWPKTTVFPTATWHKGELTTVMMNFLEAEVGGRQFPHEPLLNLVAEGTVAINTSVRLMYKGDLWLNVEESRLIAGHGNRFLRRYAELARQGVLQNSCLFMLAPKVHVMQKIFLRLHQAAQQDLEAMNPLAVSVQQCEDFISRPSRLSRRVAGGQPANQRVQERYLQGAYAEWISAGLLRRFG